MAKGPDRMRLFAHEYVLDFNAGKAAVRAGYSAKTAYTFGPQLLKRARIRAMVDELLKERTDRLRDKGVRVVEEVELQAFADIGDAFKTDGTFKPLHEMPEHIRRCIAQVEVEHRDTGPVLKLKLHDKKGSQELLMRHLGLLKDKLEVSGGVTLEQLVPKSKPQSTEGSK